MSETSNTALRKLPSVDELLRTPAGCELANAVGHAAAATTAKRAVETLRSRILIDGDQMDEAALLLHAQKDLLDAVASDRSSGMLQVINATGVVIHTNLGRAPLPAAAIGSMATASRYTALEYDLPSGRRGRRGAVAESLISELTGAEDAVIVNNGAAAAFLVLSALAAGGEVIISRGELVEIGGDFRVPDVLTASGAVLKEVGTTNRTKIADYAQAVNDQTRMVLRVHPSNFRIIGFTAAPARTDLVALAKEKRVLFYEDLGSGALINLSDAGINEPVVGDAVRDGADVVSFSGDKLLGGPQAGLIVGRKNLIEIIRRHPLYRVLRCDKLTYAALEAVLKIYRRGNAREEVPVLKAIFATAEQIAARVDTFMQLIGDVDQLDATAVDGFSAVGGGAAPGVQLRTKLISLQTLGSSAADLDRELRSGVTPVIGRIENDRLVLDLRTVAEDEEHSMLEAIRRAVERSAVAPGKL